VLRRVIRGCDYGFERQPEEMTCAYWAGESGGLEGIMRYPRWNGVQTQVYRALMFSLYCIE